MMSISGMETFLRRVGVENESLGPQARRAEVVLGRHSSVKLSFECALNRCMVCYLHLTSLGCYVFRCFAYNDYAISNALAKSIPLTP